MFVENIQSKTFHFSCLIISFRQSVICTNIHNNYTNTVVIIIIIAEMAVFNVAVYLIEERRRWPVITASPRGQYSK